MSSPYSSLKVAWNFEKLADLRAGRPIVPTQIHLVISDLCNHDCHFCLTGDAIVDTMDGDKPIRDVCVGDVVRGPDGAPQIVTEVSSREVDEVLRISVAGIGILLTTAEHPVLTAAGWVEAGRLRRGDAAAVRVWMRNARKQVSPVVELVCAQPPAEERSITYGSGACLGDDAGAEPDEEPGDRGQGWGEASRPAGRAYSAGAREYRCGGAEEDALGFQPNARPGEAPSSDDEDPVAQSFEERTAVQGLGRSPRVGSELDRGSGAMDRPAESGLPRHGAEEGHRGHAEGVLRWRAEMPGLDELRRADDPALQVEEVEVPGRIREGQGAPYGRAGSNDPRLLLAGIRLERDLGLRQVDSVVALSGRRTVYNFACEPGHAFVANGVVVHNCAYRMSGYTTNERFGVLREDGSVNNNPNRMIPAEKVREILDDAAAMGVQGIQFTGGGEPTVHPDHMDLFGHALERGLACALVTNGNILRDGWRDVLPRFSWIRVSLDAGTPQTYALVRSIAASRFERTLGNIRALREQIDMVGSPTTLGVGFVVTRENWREVGAAVYVAKEAGAHNVRIGAMFSSEGAEYYRDFWHEARDLVSMAKDAHDGPGFVVHDLFGRRIEDLEQGRPDYEFCGYENFVTYIGADQNVYRCCNTAYNHHGLLGSLEGRTFREFWSSEEKLAKFATFDARSCVRCQFNAQNRIVAGLIEPPMHPEFP